MKKKKVLKKYFEIWDGIKKKMKAINGAKETDYGKDYMKIKFNSDDDLPLNKLLNFRLMIIMIDVFLVKMVNFTYNFS